MTIIEGTPESFGWLKRPELGGEQYDVYERPSGRLEPFAHGRPRLVKFWRWEREKIA